MLSIIVFLAGPVRKNMKTSPLVLSEHFSTGIQTMIQEKKRMNNVLPDGMIRAKKTKIG